MFLCSEEVHNIYVSVQGSTVKWSVFFFIYTQWIAALLVNEILDYVQMTKKKQHGEEEFCHADLRCLGHTFDQR